MKKLSLILGVLAFCINSSTAQFYTISDLKSLVENKDADKTLAIERAAALEFNKLINQYRSENSLPLLEWDETMWLSARNHSYWMRINNRLSHQQANSGDKNPENRYFYASENNPEFSINGENILLNFSCKGKNVEETAINIAKESFEQWKSSEGHNENMLSQGFIRHGVAFCINEDNVWGADVFSYGLAPNNYIKEPLPAKKIKNLMPNYVNIQNEILNNVLNKIVLTLNIKPKQNNKLNAEAKSNAKAILHIRPTTKDAQNLILSKQETSNSRGFLGLFAKQKQVYNLVIEKKANDFNIELITQELIEHLAENQKLNNTKNLGMSVAISKTKDRIRIALVSVSV